jgi:CRISPR-associated protein (TIGR02710 family)
MRTILLLTVGGSHEPILASVRQHQADLVVFFVTGPDPVTGDSKSASRLQIIGKGLVIKASFADTAPTLPNIPSQLGLAPDVFRCVEVPPDDLDRCFAQIRAELTTLQQQFPHARIVADYTGGTKSMTAAMCLAAVAQNVELAVTTGPRGDLLKVRSGMEQTERVSVSSIRFDAVLGRLHSAWVRHAYAEAISLLLGFAAADHPGLRAQRDYLLGQARCLEAWDRFAYSEAWNLIEQFRSRLAHAWGAQWSTLMALNRGQSQTPNAAANTTAGTWADRLAALNDLWLNAERRAANARYDDAVARWYRLIEWVAQSVLEFDHQLHTGHLDASRVPADLLPSANASGIHQCGLRQAWLILERIDQRGLVKPFWAAHNKRLLDLLQARNGSLLAHGTRPVNAEDWQRLSQFTQTHVLGLLNAFAAAVKYKLAPQWPTQPLLLPP